MKRVLPAIGLFFIAPLVAEFLLGDIPINMIGALFFLAPMYGGGALLIREIMRRTGRGWPSIIVLALAYGIFEEAFLTETLFNPNYLGLNLNLLNPAYIPALGIGVWWTVFVITLHTVWSISVSIGLTESLVPDRATKPWLGWIGLSFISLLFALAAAGSAVYAVKSDKMHFIASVPQFAWSAAAVILVAVIAFLLPKPSSSRKPVPGAVPSPWLVGLLALVSGSIFMTVPRGWAWGAVAIYLALYAIMIVAVSIWCRRAGWDGLHRLALAGGAALAYAWHAFIQKPVINQPVSVVRTGNGIFALALIVLLAIAAKKNTAVLKADLSAQSIGG
jgi:hypothetical protein